MKKILIINGHPDKESFCFALAESYKKGAGTNGTDCKLINLIDLKFDPILASGYRVVSELEPDLLMMQKDIKEANHLVTNCYDGYSEMVLLVGEQKSGA